MLTELAHKMEGTMYRLYIVGLLMLGVVALQAHENAGIEGAEPHETGLTTKQDASLVTGTGADAADSTVQPYQLSVGVSIGIYGGGISIENAEGRKVNPAFWALPSVSAVIYAPFSAGSNLGAG